MGNKVICPNYKNCPKQTCAHFEPHKKINSCFLPNICYAYSLGDPVACIPIPFEYYMEKALKEPINDKNN